MKNVCIQAINRKILERDIYYENWGKVVEVRLTEYDESG